MENIQNLESQVRELSKKCDLESVLREELSLEIQALQRAQTKAFWCISSVAAPVDIALEKTSVGEETKSSSQPNTTSLHVESSTSVLTTSSISQSVGPDLVSSTHTTTTALSDKDSTTVAVASNQQNMKTNSLTERSEIVTSKKTEPSPAVSGQAVSTAPLESTSSEIERILARIEQDNRILAELEISRTTVGIPLSTSNMERLKATLEEGGKDKEAIQRASLKHSVTIQQLEELMAKLEQDNRILAELDKKRSVLGTGEIVPGIGPSPSPSVGSLLSRGGAIVPATGTGFPSIMHRVCSQTGLTEEEMLDSIDFIELPGRGRCNIYCARYSYDPLKQSPNENPEVELCLNAGDYVIIYGEMDEDGFFTGELLDGRKGLVPSNFVEKLTGEELFDFHATVLYGNRDSDDSSVSFSYAQDVEVGGSEDFLLPEDFHRMNDYVDLDDIEELDEDKEDNSEEKENTGFSKGVPPPQRLILERQLNKSLLIGWVPPEVPEGSIEAYHVYVDGFPRATVKSTERTRALIEGVDSLRPHRISVRSVSSTGYHSKDAACTIVVGKDFPLAPTCVKASHITATSALISWLPSNSNFQHVVAVNSVEVKIVKPGYFRHTVTGLSPNTLYRVSIRVKPGKLLYNDEKNPKRLEMLVNNVEFRTLMKGLPDPPVNVQVEQGPQDGTLLVTWLPVSTHNISPLVSSVTGYAVFAAGKKVADIDSPSGDHALIDGFQLMTTNKKCITVRSKSVDGLSSDSQICTVPNELLRCIQKGDLQDEVPIEGRSELSDIVEEEEEILMDTGEAKPRQQQTHKEIINHSQQEEYMDSNIDDSHNIQPVDRTDQGKPPQKSSAKHHQAGHTPPPSPVPSQRRQGWKEQSYSSRSRDSSSVSPKRQLERRNSAGQIILDPDENLSDKEIYPSTHITIPSIEITKDSISGDDCRDPDAYSEEEYSTDVPPSQRNQRNQYNSSPSQHRQQSRSQGDNSVQQQHSHSRPSDSYGHSRNTQTRGPQVQHQHPKHRQAQRRQSHHRNDMPNDLPMNRTKSSGTKGPITDYGHPSSFHRPPYSVPEHNSPYKGGPRTLPQNQPSHRGVSTAAGHNSSYPSFHNKRRSSSSGTHISQYHEMKSKYDELPDYDEYIEQIDEDGDNRARYFVALFDYDPRIMSPNTDVSSELCFQKGQVIKIYGDRDSDGFYRGELNGQLGFVPCNMVTEVQIEDGQVKGVMNQNAYPKSHITRTEPEDEKDHKWSDKQVRKMVAIYDYDPQGSSPNVDCEMELAFNAGDIIYTIGEVGEDGFCVGELNGIKGLVPLNLLREVPMDEDEKQIIFGGGTVGRPKGQEWSHFGQADCQWNIIQERDYIMPEMYQMKDGIVEVSLGHQRNHITPMSRNYHNQTMFLPPAIGMNMIENLHPGDHMYLQGPYDSASIHLLQESYHKNSNGKRPTYLDLNASPSSSLKISNSKDYGIIGQTFLLDKESSFQKQNRKGIFSSFKDMFKSGKKA